MGHLDFGKHPTTRCCSSHSLFELLIHWSQISTHIVSGNAYTRAQTTMRGEFFFEHDEHELHSGDKFRRNTQIWHRDP